MGTNPIDLSALVRKQPESKVVAVHRFMSLHEPMMTSPVYALRSGARGVARPQTRLAPSLVEFTDGPEPLFVRQDPFPTDIDDIVVIHTQKFGSISGPLFKAVEAGDPTNPTFTVVCTLPNVPGEMTIPIKYEQIAGVKFFHKTTAMCDASRENRIEIGMDVSSLIARTFEHSGKVLAKDPDRNKVYISSLDILRESSVSASDPHDLVILSERARSQREADRKVAEDLVYVYNNVLTLLEECADPNRSTLDVMENQKKLVKLLDMQYERRIVASEKYRVEILNKFVELLIFAIIGLDETFTTWIKGAKCATKDPLFVWTLQQADEQPVPKTARVDDQNQPFLPQPALAAPSPSEIGQVHNPSAVSPFPPDSQHPYQRAVNPPPLSRQWGMDTATTPLVLPQPAAAPQQVVQPVPTAPPQQNLLPPTATPAPSQVPTPPSQGREPTPPTVSGLPTASEQQATSEEPEQYSEIFVDFPNNCHKAIAGVVTKIGDMATHKTKDDTVHLVHALAFNSRNVPVLMTQPFCSKNTSYIPLPNSELVRVDDHRCIYKDARRNILIGPGDRCSHSVAGNHNVPVYVSAILDGMCVVAFPITTMDIKYYHCPAQELDFLADGPPDRFGMKFIAYNDRINKYKVVASSTAL